MRIQLLVPITVGIVVDTEEEEIRNVIVYDDELYDDLILDTTAVIDEAGHSLPGDPEIQTLIERAKHIAVAQSDWPSWQLGR